MSDQPAHALKCLKADGGHSVWLVQPPGRSQRIIKRWPLGPWICVKLLLGIAQPQRQMRGIRRLRRLGIYTPQCFGSWRVRRDQPQACVELELEYAPGVSAWELVCKHDVHGHDHGPALVSAARTIGDVVARLANGGVFHRDLKLSNIIINLKQNPPSVALIDTVGVRPMRNRPVEIMRMLDRLAVQPLMVPDALGRRLRSAVLHAALRLLNRKERQDLFILLRDFAGRDDPTSVSATRGLSPARNLRRKTRSPVS